MKQQINFNPQKAFTGTAESLRNIHKYNKTPKAERRYVRIIAVLMMIIAIFLGAVLSLARVSKDIADNDNKLRLSIETLKQRVDFSDNIFDIDLDALKSYVKNEAAMTQLHLRNTPRNQWLNAINVLVLPEDNAEFYFVRNGHEIIKSLNAGGLGLSKGDLNKLLNDRQLEARDDEGDNLYAAAPLADGFIVAMYRDIGDYTSLQLRNHLNGDGNVDLGGSGIIIYDKDSGKVYSDGGKILTETTIQDSDISPIFDNSIDIDVQSPDYDIFELVQGLNSYRTYTAELDQNTSAIAYYCLKSSYGNVLSDVFLPVAYILLTAFVLVLSASILHTVRSSARAEHEIIRIGRWAALDKLIVKRELSLFGIAAVIVTLILIYVSALTDISRQNLNASEDLISITEEEAEAQKSVEYFKAVRDVFLTGEFDKAVMLIEANENVRTDEMLKTIADNLVSCTDITIFDQSGVSIASTSGYIGYVYTDSNTGEPYEITDFYGDTTYLSEPDDNDISYYSVKLRYNSGVIRFTAVNNMFKDILESMSDDAVLLEADFGNADIMYYNASTPDLLYIAAAGDHKVKTVSNELSDEVLHDKYFGIRTINGTRYLLNIGEDTNREGNFFIDALNVKYIFSAIAGIVAYYISCLVVLLIPILLFFAPFRLRNENIVVLPEGSDIYSDTDGNGGDIPAADNIEGSDERLIIYRKGIEFSEHSFVNSVNNITAGCILMFLAYVIFGVATGNKTGSLMNYLFSSKWERGFNIFALTLCVIIIFTIWAVSHLLRHLIRIISQNAGPSGVTAYKLIESVIRFAALIATIIMVLSEVGVKTGSLLAGAGLTSAIIGIGAQSTVNNVLAGLFIIFEGNFNVGDIVEINGWVGVIKDISVRTTCIESYGNSLDYRNVRVINNSDFNNVINRSRHPSRAVVDLLMGVNDDDTRLVQIFEKNQARIKAKLIEPLDDIKYLGVQRYSETSKTIRFIVSCDEINRVFNEATLIEELGKLFEREDVMLDRYAYYRNM